MKALIFILIFYTQVSVAYIGGSFPEDQFSASISWSWGGLCSGTKVSEHHILTAAHCVSKGMLKSLNLVSIKIAGSKGIYFDPKTMESKVVNLFVHPGFGSPDRANDLAVIEIRDELIGEKAQISSASVKLTQKLVVGGFGCKGNNYPRYPNLSVAFKYPEKIGSGYIEFGIKDAEGDTYSMGCQGDSGGGVFRFNGQSFDVVGVNHAINLLSDQQAVAIVVNEKTGNIESYSGHPILRSVIFEKEDLDWLKTVLPANTFN